MKKLLLIVFCFSIPLYARDDGRDYQELLIKFVQGKKEIQNSLVLEDINGPAWKPAFKGYVFKKESKLNAYTLPIYLSQQVYFQESVEALPNGSLHQGPWAIFERHNIFALPSTADKIVQQNRQQSREVQVFQNVQELHLIEDNQARFLMPVGISTEPVESAICEGPESCEPYDDLLCVKLVHVFHEPETLVCKVLYLKPFNNYAEYWVLERKQQPL